MVTGCQESIIKKIFYPSATMGDINAPLHQNCSGHPIFQTFTTVFGMYIREVLFIVSITFLIRLQSFLYYEMFLRKHTKKIVSRPQKCSANEALAFILVSDSERNGSFVMNLQIAMTQRNSHVFVAWTFMKYKKMSSRQVSKITTLLFLMLAIYSEQIKLWPPQ